MRFYEIFSLHTFLYIFFILSRKCMKFLICSIIFVFLVNFSNLIFAGADYKSGNPNPKEFCIDRLREHQEIIEEIKHNPQSTSAAYILWHLGACDAYMRILERL